MSWGHAKLLRRWIAKEHGVHWRELLLHTESGAHWHLGHLLRSSELWHTHELWWHLHHLLLLKWLLLKSHHLLHLLTRHHLLLWSLHLLLLWLLHHSLLWFWRSLVLDYYLSWFLLFEFLFSFDLLWWCLSFLNLLDCLFFFLQYFVSLMNFLFSLHLSGFGGLGSNLDLLLLLLLLSLKEMSLLLLHDLLLLELLLLLLLLLLHHGLL